MSRFVDVERLLELLEDDREFLDEMREQGLLDPQKREFSLEEAERVRVTRTLVRELHVNWPGVEIILRMRTEILDTHAQIADLLDRLR